MDMVERVARAIDKAACPGREGPFGGYDYGHNPEFYGPPPAGGRYVIRDFRTLASKGEWLHQTDDRVLHEATLEQMTKNHIAKAAIRAMLDGQEPVAWRYDHPVFGCPIYKEPQELKRLGGDTQETPLYDLSALKEAVG